VGQTAPRASSPAAAVGAPRQAWRSIDLPPPAAGSAQVQILHPRAQPGPGPPHRRLPGSPPRSQRCLTEQSDAGTASSGLSQAQACEILQRGFQKIKIKQHLLMAKPASPPRTLCRHLFFQPDLPTKVFGFFLQANAQEEPRGGRGRFYSLPE